MTTGLHILGGGPAGLAAAHYAHRRGMPFLLHEAGTETGGNCRTLRLGDCGFDTGAHRLHAKDPEITAEFRALLGDDLLTVRAPSRIVRGNKTFRFPPEPGDLLRHLDPRLTLRIARELLAHRDGSKRPENFRDLAVGRYGETLADLFLLGYTRKLWGRDPATLSPAVAGGRLDGLHAGGAMRESLNRALHNALGIRSRPQDNHLDGTFLYPRHGIGSLFRKLEEGLPPGSVRVSSRVTRIRHDGARLRALTVFTRRGAEDGAVERVVSTLPLPFFLRALDPPPPPEILKRASAIAFRNLILCVLRLDMSRYSENASLYFPDAHIPFTRLYEPKNRSPFLAPPGQTCVVLEIPCDPGDAAWTAEDGPLLEGVFTALESTGTFRRAAVLESAVHRVPHAYPVLERGAEAGVEVLLEYCARFSNLRLAGRNALFRYAHIHDMFRQGRDAVQSLKET